jgi:hypothetical protein
VPVSNDSLRSEFGPLPSFTTERAGVVIFPSVGASVFLRAKSCDPKLPDCLVRPNEEIAGSSTSEVCVMRRATSLSEPSSVKGSAGCGLQDRDPLLSRREPTWPVAWKSWTGIWMSMLSRGLCLDLVEEVCLNRESTPWFPVGLSDG